MSGTFPDGVRIAVVGLSFGAEFVPIYQHHPQVASVVVCDARPDVLATVGDRFGVEDRYPSLDAVLADPGIDAVHLLTPLHLHAEHTLAALDAGKHVACTVPMGLSLEELRAVVDRQAATGLTFMMMETAVYTREYLHAEQLSADGAFGRISYARGTHFQDMTGWPDYWAGLPPMHYATHAVAPVLALLGTRATTVRCLGSGRNPELERFYGNPFPVESASFTLEGTDVVADVVRSLFRTARPYTEAFSVYGDRGGFEWPQREGAEPPLVFSMGEPTPDRGRPVTTTSGEVPDRADLLPPEIAGFTRASVHSDGSHLSFVQGGGHGGSHPHLVHEFVSSLVQGREPRIDARTAANWTAAGIVAHTSAMAGGQVLEVPGF